MGHLYTMGKGGDTSGSASVPIGTDFLNALVDKKVAELKEKSIRDGTVLGDEVKFAIAEQEKGSSVYHHRVKAVVYFIAAFAGYQMCYNIAAGNVSLPLFVLMTAINFVYYAIFSINLIFLDTMTTPVGRCFMSMKLLAAYYGQYCHMMAHMPSGQRPGWVQWAQDHRLMISGEDHMVHHKNYDQNFCIGPGICNPAFMAVVRTIGRSPAFWLYLWYAMMILDVPFFLHMIQNYAVPYIN